MEKALISECAIILSLLSLIFSIYSFFKTHNLSNRTQYINNKKIIAEQLGYYTNLLHNNFKLLKEKLSDLSTMLCDANRAIIESCV